MKRKKLPTGESDKKEICFAQGNQSKDHRTRSMQMEASAIAVTLGFRCVFLVFSSHKKNLINLFVTGVVPGRVVRPVMNSFGFNSIIWMRKFDLATGSR